MDSLGHQHRTKKLSPKIALHFKALCESKATLPMVHSLACIQFTCTRYIKTFGISEKNGISCKRCPCYIKTHHGSRQFLKHTIILYKKTVIVRFPDLGIEHK